MQLFLILLFKCILPSIQQILRFHHNSHLSTENPLSHHIDVIPTNQIVPISDSKQQSEILGIFSPQFLKQMA